MCWSSAVPSKGADPFAVNFVLNILDEVGYRKLVMKSDNERSIKLLKSAVKAASKMDIVLEESKTGDSQANGLAEVSVRETKGQCRAMKSALQASGKAGYGNPRCTSSPHLACSARQLLDVPLPHQWP